ncbi:MAG: hypothetical protein ACF8XB_08520 [Planctomycetota bacterium JB042]
MGVRASCDGCGRTFEVPDARKAYRCKCGGRVVVGEAGRAAPEPEPESPLDGERTCPACGAIEVDVASRYCEECGASLDAGEASPEEKAERQRANRELAKAKDSVRAVRGLYVFGAAMGGLFLVLITIAMFRADQTIPTVLLVVWALTAVGVAVDTTGALRIFREPLLWSVLIASLATCRLGLRLIDGSHWILVGLSLLWCLALWSVLGRVMRVRRLMHRYPELWHAAAIARRRTRERGGRRVVESGPLGRRRRAERAETGRRLVLAGIVVAVLAGLGVAWKVATRPPTFEDALSSFVEDWNRSDVAAIAARFDEGRRSKVERWLTRSSSRRDWSERLPSLGGEIVERRTETSARVSFDTEDGRLVTSWRLRDGGWDLSSVKVDRE